MLNYSFDLLELDIRLKNNTICWQKKKNKQKFMKTIC